MIALWLLAGSLVGGAQGAREFSELPPHELAWICLQAKESGKSLLQQDPARAAMHLQRAQRGLEDLWDQGHRTADVAATRADCSMMLGDIPGAVIWSRRGLARDPLHAPSRQIWEQAQAVVQSQLAADSQLVPRKPTATRDQDAIGAVVVFGLGCWLLAQGGVQHRRGRALGGLLVGMIGLVWGIAVDQQMRTEAARWKVPTLVIRGTNVVPRSGNGMLYPPGLEEKLPPGLEVQVQSRRGEWLQVQLASGRLVWIPLADGELVD